MITLIKSNSSPTTSSMLRSLTEGFGGGGESEIGFGEGTESEIERVC
jgi:hypothetical protein